MPTCSVIKSQHSRRPWWLELLLVDFRHAFWPWLCYTVTMSALPADNFYYRADSVFWFGFVFLSPAVLAALYSSEFSHGTICTLLSFERSRFNVQCLRAVLSAVLMYLPLLLNGFIFFYVPRSQDWNGLAVSAIVVTCHLGVAPLLAFHLRKPLLVWSAIVVSPMILMLAMALIVTLFNINQASDRFTAFPNISISSTIAVLSGALLSFLLGFRYWRRMEVRS